MLGQWSACIHSNRHLHLDWQSVPHWGTMIMVFIETSIFTNQIQDLLNDDYVRALQEWIATSPTAGNLIKGSGGCRKLRWNTTATGKRGGIRVVYYWMKDRDMVLLLLAYAKSRTDDLSQAQIKMLCEMVKLEIR
jgi:mRNA-degrading endonuclease RelE of RelBE toxin-antitoxin system